MDASLAQLAKCEQLGLSTNQIEKISNLNGLSCLRILSLGRNSIKKIEGLDAVSDTLEELWVSYNQIERLNGIECCKKLKVLYASNNKIKLWEGVTPLQSLPLLEDLLLVGNPIEEKCTADGTWTAEISKKFTSLKKLDGKPIIREDELGGGIFSANPSIARLSTNAIEAATRAAMTVLTTSDPSPTTAVEAVTAAIASLESDPHPNAGHGSNLTREGTVECDASIMEGSRGAFGAVGALSGVRHPIMAAKAVLEREMVGNMDANSFGLVPMMCVVGEGARTWCLRASEAGGLGLDPMDNNGITDRSKRKWELATNRVEAAMNSLGKRKKEEDDRPHQNIAGSWESARKVPASTFLDDIPLDTVGAVVVDRHGNLASGVSSGGIHLKTPGRVGHAAAFGAGVWAQNPGFATYLDVDACGDDPDTSTVGVGCSLSGTGEQIMKTLLAREIALAVAAPDVDPSEALRSAMTKFESHPFLTRFRSRDAGAAVVRVTRELGGGGNLTHRDGTDVANRFRTEVWFAHTTEAMAVGWWAEGEKRPRTKISRRSDGKRMAVWVLKNSTLK
ncbi:taspase, threonine aspartase, 1 [Irineochytrium annulatum]|nr:taspase, threonine aspartase, 1 [Irineochytrium annulatum]